MVASKIAAKLGAKIAAKTMAGWIPVAGALVSGGVRLACSQRLEMASLTTRGRQLTCGGLLRMLEGIAVSNSQ